MDETICGQSLDAIRKAYFKGKMQKLLTDIQSTGDHGGEEYEKLKAYLGELQAKDAKLTTTFSDFLPKLTEDIDPALDELSEESLTEAEIRSLELEKNNRENASRMAAHMLRGLFKKFYEPNAKHPSEEELMDMAFELLSLQYYLNRDALYKERLYRRKIVYYERQGKQRKLAEETAKVSVEYRDYILAEDLKSQVNEFILLAKKRYKDL